MAAETPSNAQQRGFGICSTVMRGCGAGAMVTGVSGALATGISISGCVFFICTPGRAGGSGRTVIRAVSFFGPRSSGGITGNGIAAAAVDPVVVAGGRGAGGSGLGAACAGLIEGETGGR